MYHGTSEQSAVQIEQHGFRASEDGMLGRGVYLSRDICKAKRYGPVILKCSVEVGRVRRIDRMGHPDQRRWHEAGLTQHGFPLRAEWSHPV
eukprot:CAMPEP_0117556128 /NCGR_PEP_ID=MMETSP0784-20121206/51641_1 /TAXON_ID=39447 /ORGANISM="" /LENGTH=90 /DNA_ID=CAMNT_0005353377 /DNA_START=221 /DNA_END=494 /DNA_ORIENTATION=+